MKAIAWNGELQVREDFPHPEPKDGEALVKISMAGICNTDLEITRGYLGFTGIIGHEFVGIVEETRGGRTDLIGKRVVGEINCGCGTCEYCLRGMKSHCPARTTLGIVNRNGAFAEYITLPAANLLEIPGHVPDEEAVFAEPLAAAFEITDQVHIKPTDRVLVMGDGKLGLLCTFVLALTQAHVTLAGKHADKLNMAKGRGIDVVMVSDLGTERVYDVVVEATGRVDGIEAALKLIRPRGAIILKSTTAGQKGMNLSPIVIDEITVIGSRCGPFGPAIRAISRGLIDVKPLITAVYPFRAALEAFAKAREKESLKVIIDFRNG